MISTDGFLLLFLSRGRPLRPSDKGNVIGILSDAADEWQFASVADVSEKHLWLSFLSERGVEGGAGPGLLRLLSAGHSAILVFSPTYYVSYSPVLDVLQQLQSRRLPFEDTLLAASSHAKETYSMDGDSAMSDCCKMSASCTDDSLFSEGEDVSDDKRPWTDGAPRFLTKSSTMDWSNVLELQHTSTRANEESDSPISDSESSARSSSYAQHIGGHRLEERASMSEFSSLAKSRKLRLDETQLEAVRLALKQRVVLIQGPPGSGKTFIGLTWVRLLLSLRPALPGPILVMTYKNHALDEFLKAIAIDVGYPDGVVRVGGRAPTEEESRERSSAYGEVRVRDGITHLSGHASIPGFKKLRKIDSTVSQVRKTAKRLKGVTCGYDLNVFLQAAQREDLLKAFLSSCPRHIWRKFSKNQRSRMSDIIGMLDRDGEITVDSVKNDLGQNAVDLLKHLVNEWARPAFKQIREAKGASHCGPPVQVWST